MSDNHDAIKNNPRWHAVRLACFERDDYTCVECGATEGLQADHEPPLAALFAFGIDAEAIEQALDLDGLRTLCGSCNARKGARLTDATTRGVYVHEEYPELRDLIAIES